MQQDERPMATAGVTRELAAFVHRTGWAEIPLAVRHEAARALVNYFAVALAGAPDPTLDKAVSLAMRFRAGGDAGSAASVIGRRVRMDMPHAAALNAMSANVYDFDDTHLPTIIHPTAPVAAALFALAEAQPISGADFLLAFVLGVEVACRIGNAVSPDHYQRGAHITSTCGVFGAAAAAAKALGLDVDPVVWALGNASAQACGLVETLGTMAKSLSVGNAARNGLLSALLAADGFSGPEAPLEGARGFLRVASQAPRAAATTDALGQDWALMRNTYKPYPCGVVLNPVIEACLALRRHASWRFEDVERVVLTGHPLLRERTDRPGVRTGRAAQVSAQHAVAVTLARGKAGLAEFSDDAVADPRLRALGARIEFVDAPSWQVDAAEVTVILRSGERARHRVAAAHGSLASPLTDDELADKLRTLAVHGGAGVDSERLLDTLWRLDALADAAAPMRIAVPER